MRAAIELILSAPATKSAFDMVQQSYSATAKWLHWLIALAVVILAPTGLVMARLLDSGALQDRLFVLHESLGVTVLTLMLARIAVRLRGAPPPDANLSPRECMFAHSVHGALYLLLLLTPILGWLALSAYGLGPSFFWIGQLPQLLAKDEPLSKTLFTLHLAGGLLIIAFVLLHVGTAIRHAHRRDGVVQRMLPVIRTPLE